MRREHDELKVGVTVVVVMALLVGVLVFIGKWDRFFRESRQVTVCFDARAGIQGLRVDDPVTVGKVPVGRVTQIYHREDATSRQLFVYVAADIPKNISIYNDAKVAVSTRLVGEGGSLDVLDVGGGEGSHLLGPDETVMGTPTASIDQLMDRLGTLLGSLQQQLDVSNADSLLSKIHKGMDNVNAVTSDLKSETNRENKEALVAELHRALASLNDALARVQGMLERSGPKIENTVTHVEQTAKVLDTQIATPLARELNRDDPNSLLAKVRDGVGSAQAGMANFRDVTATLGDLVRVNRPSLQSMVDNLSETADHLRATAKDLRLNPWRLLYRPTKPEAEYANLMATARDFAEAAVALDQANARLAVLMQTHPQGVDVQDPELTAIRERVEKTFCQFEEAQKKLWDLLKVPR